MIKWILIAVAALQLASCQRVHRIGNKLKASTVGVDVPRTIFLLNDIVLDSGVVFAFSGFFRSNKQVALQIWRPMGTSGDTFRLIWQIPVTPSVLEEQEDIYIESKLKTPCVLVEAGDRLGVYHIQDPGAVAYTFNASRPTAMAFTVDKDDSITVNETVMFGSLSFPYTFSIAAYVDTDLSRYTSRETFQQCPNGLLIPSHIPVTLPSTTSRPPPTGRPGATGATGPLGVPGIPGDVGATGATGQVGMPGSPGYPGRDGLLGQIGATGQMGPAGVNGVMGPSGPPGMKGDKGEQGIPGPPGPPGSSSGGSGSSSGGPGGAQGPPGPPGPPGLPGPQGLPGQNSVDPKGGKSQSQAVSSTEESEEFFGSAKLGLILFIWIIILSVLLIIFMCITVGLCIKVHRKPNRNNKILANGTDNSAWISNMKDDTYKDYSIETVSTEEPISSSNSSTSASSRERLASISNSDYNHGRSRIY